MSSTNPLEWRKVIPACCHLNCAVVYCVTMPAVGTGRSESLWKIATVDLVELAFAQLGTLGKLCPSIWKGHAWSSAFLILSVAEVEVATTPSIHDGWSIHPSRCQKRRAPGSSSAPVPMSSIWLMKDPPWKRPQKKNRLCGENSQWVIIRSMYHYRTWPSLTSNGLDDQNRMIAWWTWIFKTRSLGPRNDWNQQRQWQFNKSGLNDQNRMIGWWTWKFKIDLSNSCLGVSKCPQILSVVNISWGDDSLVFLFTWPCFGNN